MELVRPTLLHVLAAFLLLVQSAAAQARADRDTLNQTDATGRRQGWWQVVAPVADKPDYNAGQLIEEGRYTDGKRAGEWTRFWPNGKEMSRITYVNGRPKGRYIIFYPTGKMEEQGSWDMDRNTGSFKRWHPNGQLSQDFVFDQYGLRDGQQRYFHENGQLEVEVNIHEGKEQGTLKRYHANGELQQVAQFNDGVINAENSRYIRSVKKPEPVAPAEDAKPAPNRSDQEAPNSSLFRENGYNTLYDRQLRITQQGEFKSGMLWKGKVYRYDKAGLLFRIEVYQEGRYVGNAIIEDEDRR